MLIDNLESIRDSKYAIKNALIRKGLSNVSNSLSTYAELIDSLVLCEHDEDVINSLETTIVELLQEINELKKLIEEKEDEGGDTPSVPDDTNYPFSLSNGVNIWTSTVVNGAVVFLRFDDETPNVILWEQSSEDISKIPEYFKTIFDGHYIYVHYLNGSASYSWRWQDLASSESIFVDSGEHDQPRLRLLSGNNVFETLTTTFAYRKCFDKDGKVLVLWHMSKLNSHDGRTMRIPDYTYTDVNNYGRIYANSQKASYFWQDIADSKDVFKLATGSSAADGW